MKSLSWKISVVLIALQSSGVINVQWYILLLPVILVILILALCLILGCSKIINDMLNTRGTKI